MLMRYTDDVIPDRLFKRAPDNPTIEDFRDPETRRLIIERERRNCNENAMPQVEALLKVGWTIEFSERDLEPWQWSWRAPPKRKNSLGRLYHSTNQAFNAMVKQ